MNKRNIESTYRIEDGCLIFNGEANHSRDSALVQGRCLLFAFAEALSIMDSCGYFGNESAVREKFQALYDQFEAERDFVATSEYEEGRFDLIPYDENFDSA